MGLAFYRKSPGQGCATAWNGLGICAGSWVNGVRGGRRGLGADPPGTELTQAGKDERCLAAGLGETPHPTSACRSSPGKERCRCGAADAWGVAGRSLYYTDGKICEMPYSISRCRGNGGSAPIAERAGGKSHGTCVPPEAPLAGWRQKFLCYSGTCSTDSAGCQRGSMGSPLAGILRSKI